jgi:hypothetical protein
MENSLKKKNLFYLIDSENDIAFFSVKIHKFFLIETIYFLFCFITLIIQIYRGEIIRNKRIMIRLLIIYTKLNILIFTILIIIRIVIIFINYYS